MAVKNKHALQAILIICGILALIFDSPTAASGARAGIGLCVQTVIPSLFPFFVLSAFLTGILQDLRFIGGHLICRAWNVPDGCESLIVISLVGGYPIGAKIVADAYAQNNITDGTYRHLISFCNNAGPAFIFGITSLFFRSPLIPWLLWILQILSAHAVAWVLGNPHVNAAKKSVAPRGNSYAAVMLQSLRSMAIVCGWIVFFRVMISLLEKWLLKFFPGWTRIVICGLIELSNGCCMINEIPGEDIRFLICSILLCAGGLCITMQTLSFIPQKAGNYLRGKAQQCTVCALLSAALVPFVFPSSVVPRSVCAACALILVLLFGYSFVRNSSRKKEEIRV